MESDFLKSDMGRALLPILSDAGFEQGDFLPLYSWNALSAKVKSITSTTYTILGALFETRCRWDQLLPSAVQEQVLTQVQIKPGTDETADVRLYNETDGETIHEKTGITSNQVVTLGPTSYTPPTANDTLWIALEGRTNPGANSTDFWESSVTLGVKL